MGADEFSRSTRGANTSARLLQVACELAGGQDRLAERLKMSRLLLRWYMAGRDELPGHLLLKTVDYILEERESLPPLPEQDTPPAAGPLDGADAPA